jgi:hypothetical protein
MTLLDGGKRIVAACVPVAAAALLVAVGGAAAPDAAKNLIVNGTAEQGEAANGYDIVAEIPGWIRKGGFTVVRYGAGSGFPEPSVAAALRGGSNFFAGGPANANSAISQDVSVISKKSLIDSGKAKATLSGYIGGFSGQNDSLIATALFLSESGAKLGSARIGPVGAAARQTVTGMLKRTATKPVPRKTRTIRVVLAASRNDGSYNDGYADNLSLTISR